MGELGEKVDEESLEQNLLEFVSGVVNGGGSQVVN
jgi:hypothetical protein